MKEILLQCGKLEIKGFYGLSAWTVWNSHCRISTVGYSPTDSKFHADEFGCWPQNDDYQVCGIPVWGY